jgi:hypothetical protein
LDPAQGLAGASVVFGGWGSGEGIASRRTAGALQFGLELFTGWNSRLQIAQDGTVTIPGHLNVPGGVTAAGKSFYVADHFVNRLGEALEQGDVVVIGEAQPDLFAGDGIVPIAEVDLTGRAYDTRVCGIVADVQGEVVDGGEEVETYASTVADGTGSTSGVRRYRADERDAVDLSKVEPGQVGAYVTLGAFSFCKVDAEIAPIEIGDLLTTSPTRGHAQKVLDSDAARGAIIGKALAPLAEGRGKIPVLVTLH